MIRYLTTFHTQIYNPYGSRTNCLKFLWSCAAYLNLVKTHLLRFHKQGPLISFSLMLFGKTHQCVHNISKDWWAMLSWKKPELFYILPCRCFLYFIFFHAGSNYMIFNQKFRVAPGLLDFFFCVLWPYTGCIFSLVRPKKYWGWQNPNQKRESRPIQKQDVKFWFWLSLLW